MIPAADTGMFRRLKRPGACRSFSSFRAFSRQKNKKDAKMPETGLFSPKYVL